MAEVCWDAFEGNFILVLYWNLRQLINCITNNGKRVINWKLCVIIPYSQNFVNVDKVSVLRNVKTTNFLFHNSNVLQSIKENNIPNYVITDIQIIEKDKIIIKSDHAEITLLYKRYGKEKYELRDKNFITVLNNLKNIF